MCEASLLDYSTFVYTFPYFDFFLLDIFIECEVFLLTVWSINFIFFFGFLQCVECPYWPIQCLEVLCSEE